MNMKKMLKSRCDKFGGIVTKIEEDNPNNKEIKVLITLLDILMEWN